MKSKGGHKDNHITGCGGCLTVIAIGFSILLVAIAWVYIDDTRTRKKYMEDPEPAHRDIVEGYAGIEFPPYKLVETIMNPRRGRFEWSDTIRMEFLEVPDASFYERIKNACKQEYHLHNEETTITYRPWHFDKEQNKYHFSFNAFYNQTMYDTVRNAFVSRGVPKDFVQGDRNYEIYLPVFSKEWIIITGIH